MHRRSHHAQATTLTAALASGLALLIGCSSGPAVEPAATAPEAGPPVPEGRPTGSPEPRTLAGLRTVRVRFAGPMGRVPQALERLQAAGHAEPLAIEAALREAGLRAYLLEPGAVERLLRDAPPAGAIETGWSGTLPRWSPLVQAEFGGSPRLHHGAGFERAPAGRLRLLARSWIEPDIRPGVPIAVRLRLDLRPTLRARRSAVQRSIERIDGSGTMLGEPIGPIRLDMSLRPGRALLLVAARPGADWPTLAEALRGGADARPPIDPIILDDPTEHGPTLEQGEAPSRADDPEPEHSPEPSRALTPEAGPSEPLRDTIGSVLLGLSPEGTRGGLVLIAAPDRSPPPWTIGSP